MGQETGKTYSEKDALHLKQETLLKIHREVRFKWGEVGITVAVVFLIIGLIIPFVYQYVKNAERATQKANAQNIHLAVTASVILDNPTEDEIEDFLNKYSVYQSLDELLNPRTDMESNIGRLLSNSNYELKKDTEEDVEDVIKSLPVKGYMKIEKNGDEYKVYLSEKMNGEEYVCFPESE